LARLVFVSDVHLGPRSGAEQQLFLDLLSALRRRQLAGQPQSLFVLGDLFSFWIDRSLVAGLFRPVLEALAALSASGCAITLLEGNRDFGGGRVLRGSTGASLPGEHTVLERGGHRVLLLHGDQLLTRDRRYQLFKRLVRCAPARLLARLLPAPLLLWTVRRLEGVSASEKSRKRPEHMQIDQAAAGRAAAAAGADILVHGHTHRPERTVLQTAGRPLTVYALGAWGPEGATVLDWPELGEPGLVQWPQVPAGKAPPGAYPAPS
jgi:UDP-2,3-diacylglucosamine hydrolase